MLPILGNPVNASMTSNISRISNRIVDWIKMTYNTNSQDRLSYRRLGRTRTDDLLLVRQPLSLLSYESFSNSTMLQHMHRRGERAVLGNFIEAL